MLLRGLLRRVLTLNYVLGLHQGLVREQLRYEALPGSAPPDDAFVTVQIRCAPALATPASLGNRSRRLGTRCHSTLLLKDKLPWRGCRGHARAEACKGCRADMNWQ